MSGIDAISTSGPGNISAGKDRMMTTAYAFVGCRTTVERNARGKGIVTFRYDPTTGEWNDTGLLAAQENPSFLALDASQKRLYTVHGDGTDASAFVIDEATGGLSFLNRRTTKGRNPAHLTLVESGTALAVANYATGTIATLPIGADGSLGEVTRLVSMPGEPGPHRIEQGSSHPHHIPVLPGSNWHVVPDKGLDTVFLYRWSAGAAEIHGFRARESAGPRHAAFNPKLPLVYVANELDSTVTVWQVDAVAGALAPRQCLSLMPTDYQGANRASGIAVTPDGKSMFVSNRGHESVTGFAVDPATGLLELRSWTNCGGKKPRFITLDPSGFRLFVANEDTDTIVEFQVGEQPGTLKPTGQVIRTGSPTCIVFKTI